jgi:hypothetical protein
VETAGMPGRFRGKVGISFKLLSRNPQLLEFGQHPPMPVARTPGDIMCLAVYALAGGKILRGLMMATIADRPRISFEQAEEMAIAAAEAGYQT